MNTGNGPKGGLNAAVAATLNGERVAQGYTFDQLADMTGISARSLKRYLSGAERDLTVATLGTIAAALDLPLTEVIHRADIWLGREDSAEGVQEKAARIVKEARAEARRRRDAADDSAVSEEPRNIRAINRGN